MRWFKDHPKISIALIAVLILAVLFYISLLSVGKSNFLGRTLGVAVVQIQKPFTFVGDAVSGKVSSFTSADATEQENQELKDKIFDLEQELSRAKLSDSELRELRQLSKAFDDQDVMREYEPVAAELISYDGSNIFNVFTVNAGSASGVKTDDAVVNDSGLIGRVASVGKNSCKVIAVINESNKIGFQMTKNMRFRGVCQGTDGSDLSGYLFNTDADVKEGDIVITSGTGGVYPPGLQVGTIATVNSSRGNPLKNITIKPAVNFKSIKKVAILTGDIKAASDTKKR